MVYGQDCMLGVQLSVCSEECGKHFCAPLDAHSGVVRADCCTRLIGVQVHDELRAEAHEPAADVDGTVAS